MKRVLWLCSWYPNRIKPFEGDFVQRHAQAASLYNKIDVIKLCPDENINQVEIIHTNDLSYPNLSETSVYYPYSKSPIGRLKNIFLWSSLYKKIIKGYINKNGLPDLVHVNIPFKDGLLAMWMKRKYDVKYLVTEHWGGYNNVVKENISKRPFWFSRIIKRTLQHASVVHSVSNKNIEQMEKYMFPFTSKIVIPNVVNADIFSPVDKRNDVKQPKLFVHISDGSDVKNVDGIFNVFKSLDTQSYKLVVVGFEKEKNQRYQQQFPMIDFVGQVTYNQVPRYLQDADALVVFSNMENAPCVIAEAICCNTFVIATNVGGIAEMVNENNSILMDAGDQDALASAVQSIAKRAPVNNNIFADRYSYKNVGAQFSALYHQILDNKS